MRIVNRHFRKLYPRWVFGLISILTIICCLVIIFKNDKMGNGIDYFLRNWPAVLMVFLIGIGYSAEFINYTKRYLNTQLKSVDINDSSFELELYEKGKQTVKSYELCDLASISLNHGDFSEQELILELKNDDVYLLKNEFGFEFKQIQQIKALQNNFELSNKIT